MSSAADPFYPIAVIEDRYSGTYSGGAWLALSRANAKVEGENLMRAEWVLADGPGGDDITCGVCWGKLPAWIAVGDSPDAAVAMLQSKESPDDSSWSADYLHDEHPVALKRQAFVKHNSEAYET